LRIWLPHSIFFLPASISLRLLRRRLQFGFVQLALQQLQGLGLVVQLAARLGVLDDDAAGCVPQAHTGLHLVHVLSTGTTAAEGIPGDVRRIDVDLDAFRPPAGYTYTLTKLVWRRRCCRRG
jgi:hypothetical protein